MQIWLSILQGDATFKIDEIIYTEDYAKDAARQECTTVIGPFPVVEPRHFDDKKT